MPRGTNRDFLRITFGSQGYQKLHIQDEVERVEPRSPSSSWEEALGRCNRGLRLFLCDPIYGDSFLGPYPMTPIGVLQAFATSMGWEVRIAGDGGQLVDIDRGGAHVILAVLTTRGGGFPARVVFRKFEVPDVVARDADSFKQALNSLRKLEAFRHLAFL